MARMVTVAVEHRARLGADRLGRREQDRRIEIALQRDAPRDALARAAEVDRPVEADRIDARRRELLEPEPAALRERDRRHARAVVLALELREHASDVVEREALIGAVGERAAPRIEDHHRLRAGFDLRVQIRGHCLRIDVENPVHQVGPRVRHRFHGAEIVRAAAFDHVARERPRAAGEADQRHALAAFAVGERAANLAHRVGHVAERRADVRHRELRDVGLGAHRMRELRPLARGEIEAQPHRVGNRQDVGEQDRGVERKALERLQRHFGRVIGLLREPEEAARARARCVVLGQVAARLAHQPDRRVVGRLAQQRAQEGVVEESLGHDECDEAKRKGAFYRTRRAARRSRPYDARRPSVMIRRPDRPHVSRKHDENEPDVARARLLRGARPCTNRAAAGRARVAARRRARARHAARMHDGRLQAVHVPARGRRVRRHRHRHGGLAREIARREDGVREDHMADPHR
ncbi:hypothetical protein BURPS1710b_0171 [Burkholderia pseudomallei 1710b]|uniref:Uncharacterized protein n=1 Tax=Burkholderia pseudomallei (strain 1710b) TaxID=320372 RepID=Q3JXW6_BURP1|nr:hypothetical protein BURPS1710b_0171 [Burkholderia pseudomallei 1710b]